MSIQELTRELRKNQTKAEKKFWEKVRNRKLDGCKFLRQYPIRFEIDGIWRAFIADFYCAKAKLVIELDGSIHAKQQEYDNNRTQIINNLGYRVVRFKNFEVLHNFPSVAKKLQTYF